MSKEIATGKDKGEKWVINSCVICWRDCEEDSNRKTSRKLDNHTQGRIIWNTGTTVIMWKCKDVNWNTDTMYHCCIHRNANFSHKHQNVEEWRNSVVFLMICQGLPKDLDL